MENPSSSQRENFENGHGHVRGDFRPVAPDNLCRIEQHRVERISLPLETRTLQSGDEIAVRSSDIVIRLWLRDDSERRYSGGESARFGSAGVERSVTTLAFETGFHDPGWG